MAVQCLTFKEKTDLYDDWMSGEFTKTELSREYGVSTRTVTRVLDEMEQEAIELEEIIEDQEAFLDDDYKDLDSDDGRWLYDDDVGEWEWNEGVDDEEVEYHFIATPESLTITKIMDGVYSGQVNADLDHPRFSEASNIVWNDRGSQESLEQAYELLDQKSFIEKYSNGVITVDPELGRVFYSVGGYEQDFSGRLVPRLIQSLNEDGENSLAFQGLLKFTERLASNPSNRAVNELYNFLEASCIDIDEEGMVIAFKKVRSNYTDIFSGKFDNSPGSVCEVPRNMVDENSEQTCSYGLHVCSSSYLPCFGSLPGNKVVKVKVDPADFVAIPKEYYKTNDGGEVEAKARVCRYEVLEDVTDVFLDGQFYA